MNKLSDYHILEELLKEKKNELWRLQQEYNSIVQQEPYMRGRLKNRQHTIYKLAGEIKSIEKELRQMKSLIKDSLAMLQLMGLTVDADCEKIYTKGESTEDQCKDGGPGSGVKGHTTSKEPSYTSRSGYNFEEPKVIEAAIKKVKESGHPDPYYLSGLERALELSKKERGMKDDDATEMGAFEQLGQNHETEAMEPEEHPVLAQDDEVGEKFKTVMEEFGKGELESSSGEKVTDPKQAKAIAYSEQREATKDEKFEVIYSTGKWPNEVKTYKEIFNAPYEEAKKMAESKKRGDYYRLVQVTKVKDSDPKVAEANKLINLFGGAM